MPAEPVPDRSAEFLSHAPFAHRNSIPLPVESNLRQHNHHSCHSHRRHRNGRHIAAQRQGRDPTVSKQAPGDHDTRTADAQHAGACCSRARCTDNHHEDTRVPPVDRHAHESDPNAREQHPDVQAPAEEMRVAGRDAHAHGVGQLRAVAQAHAVAQTVPGVAAGPACRGRIE